MVFNLVDQFPLLVVVFVLFEHSPCFITSLSWSSFTLVAGVLVVALSCFDCKCIPMVVAAAVAATSMAAIVVAAAAIEVVATTFIGGDVGFVCIGGVNDDDDDDIDNIDVVVNISLRERMECGIFGK